MRSLLGSVFLLILIAVICLWCALSTERAVGALTDAAEGDVSELEGVWKDKRFCLSLAVHRTLLDKCERCLMQMQSYKENDPHWVQARCEFLSTLSAIQKSYGVHFGAVL